MLDARYFFPAINVSETPLK